MELALFGIVIEYPSMFPAGWIVPLYDDPRSPESQPHPPPLWDDDVTLMYLMSDKEVGFGLVGCFFAVVGFLPLLPLPLPLLGFFGLAAAEAAAALPPVDVFVAFFGDGIFMPMRSRKK